MFQGTLDCIVIFLRSLRITSTGASVENDEVTEVVTQLRAACQDLTCFYISGHGIEQKAMENMLEYARKFFSLPLEKKNEMNMGKSKAYRGYIQLGRTGF